MLSIKISARAAPVAERLRALFLNQSFDHLTAVSGAGSSPALATRETSKVLLAGVPGGFLGVLSFSPTYYWPVSYELN